MRASLAVFIAAAALTAAGPAQAATPTFAPFASYPTGTGLGPGPAPVNTVAADFDNDGDQDVATTSQFGQANAIVVPNNGNGTFGAPVQVAGTSGSQSLVTGDVNGDGNADLVGMTPNKVLVVLGNGHGGFAAPRSYAVTLGGQVQAILVDLNGDGKLDIAAPTFTAIQTLIGNGDGTFHSGPTTQVPAGVLSAISSAKLDSDSTPDLLAVDGFSGSVFELKGTGTGAFTVGSQLTAGFIPEDVSAVDLNGDGIDDVAVIGSFSFSLATALSDGHEGFGSAFLPDFQSGGPGPTSLGIADLDGDGKQDLVVSDVANPLAPSLLVFSGNGTVHPNQTATLPVDRFPQNPAIADLNGDGRLDIAVAGTGTLSVLLNTTP
jgi:hypothetical protein